MGHTDPDKTCRYCKEDTGHELKNCVHLQRKKDLQAHHQAGMGVKLKVPAPGGHRRAAKVDPTIPISSILQYDELLSTLASNTISMETKQRVMERAVSTCPAVNLNIQGKEVPSLMDSGLMVTLVQEGYFEKNILPVLKTSPGELSEAPFIV